MKDRFDENWGDPRMMRAMARGFFGGDRDERCGPQAMRDGWGRGMGFGPGGRRGHGRGERGGPEFEDMEGFGGRGPGRGRPLEQGDLRWLALDLIAQQPRHGYEVIKAIEDALGGHYAPSPGAVYPMLTMLEDTGLLTAEFQGTKKLYVLTDAGRAEIEANKEAIDAAKARLKEALHRFGGVPAPELFRAMGNLRGALRVRLSKGEISPESLATITAAIDRAASEIERS